VREFQALSSARSGAAARRLLASALLASAILPLPVRALAPQGACTPATAADRLDAVTRDGELVLRSRGAVRLSGLRLADGAPTHEAALAWLRDRVGREVLVAAGSARDRWDRLPARVILAGGAGRLDVALGLLETGLALVDPAIADGVCLAEALALEAAARERGLGLWAEDRYKPVPVGNVARLQERIGQFTLVEGRIRSVGERRQQTYLNFGTNWATDFTIVVPKPVWSRLQERGLGRAALEGRRIRARGVLEERQGPALAITLPEAVELLEQPSLQR
jgi:Staphylococcal nuclease homologue